MAQQDNSPVGRLYAALDPASNMAKIPKHFYVERQNKLAALYAGLLDLAHREGIKRIETTLVQPPADANGHTAICAATVELADGRIFSGIGDANASNVGRMIAMHCIRMAETRAKARALRDALNIGGTAAEEFGTEKEDPDADADYVAAVSQTKPTQQHRPDPPANVVPLSLSPHVVEGDDMPTQQQLDRLFKLQTACGRPVGAPDDITGTLAAAMILELVGIFNAQSRGGRAQR